MKTDKLKEDLSYSKIQLQRINKMLKSKTLNVRRIENLKANKKVIEMNIKSLEKLIK